MLKDGQDFALCIMCVFYQGGDCRRRSPHIAADTGKSTWPLVAVNEWCGDYRRDPGKERVAGVEPA